MNSLEFILHAVGTLLILGLKEIRKQSPYRDISNNASQQCLALHSLCLDSVIFMDPCAF